MSDKNIVAEHVIGGVKFVWERLDDPSDCMIKATVLLDDPDYPVVGELTICLEESEDGLKRRWTLTVKDARPVRREPVDIQPYGFDMTNMLSSIMSAVSEEMRRISRSRKSAALEQSQKEASQVERAGLIEHSLRHISTLLMNDQR